MQIDKPSAAPTVSQIVRADYRTADVLKKWGINYCCGANLPLADACAVKGVDEQLVAKELAAATKTVRLSNALQYTRWPVAFLIDYISHVHHDYLKLAIPSLRQALQSFVTGHTKQYPYLQAVEETFGVLSDDLLANTEREEHTFFPYAKQICHAYDRREVYGALFVRTLRKPLAESATKDQARMASLLQELRKQTNNYSFPSHVCTNHQVIYHKLREFDDDLTQHKHLENDILLPKVLEMEAILLEF